jgi:hypothetical protein
MGMRRLMVLAATTAAVALLGGCMTDSAMSPKKATFVGSEKCGSCHVDEYKTWKDTYHSKMVRTPTDGLLKDARDNWAKDSKGNPVRPRPTSPARRRRSTTSSS